MSNIATLPSSLSLSTLHCYQHMDSMVSLFTESVICRLISLFICFYNTLRQCKIQHRSKILISECILVLFAKLPDILWKVITGAWQRHPTLGTIQMNARLNLAFWYKLNWAIGPKGPYISNTPDFSPISSFFTNFPVFNTFTNFTIFTTNFAKNGESGEIGENWWRFRFVG